MKVLSLFNGLGCGRIALDNIDADVDTYYAAEINPYANAVFSGNYPDDPLLGDVNNWREWDIDWAGIDLVMGGFPCQAWSIAGKQLGDKDDRGKLFWVMLDIMTHVREHNPSAHILIENVTMKREFEEYVTHHTKAALGEIHKIHINSNILVPQSRPRYYWTSFPVKEPEQRHYSFSGILEHGYVDVEYSYCIDANYHKGGDFNQYFNKSRRQMVFKDSQAWFRSFAYINEHPDDAVQLPKVKGEQYRKWVFDFNGAKHEWELQRHLTPLECERLQGIPDGFTVGVSNTQRYIMIGNAWTVDVIEHILSHIVD